MRLWVGGGVGLTAFIVLAFMGLGCGSAPPRLLLPHASR